MSLRIIAGRFRGHPLESVKGRGTRPLLGQVREALFNILQSEVEDAVVWDLFAGTGASGLEALSRGARRVVFVEKARRAIDVLEANLERLGVEEDEAVVVRGNAWVPGEARVEAGEGDEGDTDDAGDSGGGGEAAAGAGTGTGTGAGTGTEAGTGRGTGRGRGTGTGTSDAFAEAPDLVFFDPPYPDVRRDPTRSVACAAAILERMRPGGRLVFHFPVGVLDEDDFEGVAPFDLRSWGQAAVVLLEAE